ncbi:992bd59f-c947-4386-bcd8-7b3793a1c7f1 [Thermothielavioides terrestris]|uniref:992bd59f-c947-4386-bcd8-7b3793a1c7f1 n=1 Tax=Thermothielavioides terrestris TaxID=2587410 RepID=A0A3S5CXU1_9PEZI|nr:992bd59f-c947-4386-bcd8-7b3793a1c7f1 [Thermothielavioides terrestris]
MLSLAALPSLLPNLSNLSTLLRSTPHRPRHDGHAIPEDDLLNSIWIGLLGVEALMVLGVALRGLVGAVAASR